MRPDWQLPEDLFDITPWLPWVIGYQTALVAAIAGAEHEEEYYYSEPSTAWTLDDLSRFKREIEEQRSLYARSTFLGPYHYPGWLP